MLQYKPGAVVDIGNGEWALILEVTKNQVMYYPLDLTHVQFALIEDFNTTAKANK